MKRHQTLNYTSPVRVAGSIGQDSRLALWGFLASLLLGLSLGARAEQPVDLYRVEVLVASQSAGERERAAREALRELVVRVSGDRSALEQPTIEEAASRAQDFVYEFNYAPSPETLTRDGRELPASRLILKFSPVEIERLLRRAELAFWPARRPSVLVWLVARNREEGLHRVTDSELRAQLRRHAQARGLPLILPLDDLEDRLALTPRQVWAWDEESVRKASERYAPDAILIGRYSPTSEGGLRSDWQLYHSLGNPSFDLRSQDLEQLMTGAIDRVADHFVERYAIVPREEGPGDIVMQIGGILDFGDYKSVERYLEDLAMVRRMEFVSLDRERLTLRLVTEGELASLISTLERDRRLALSPRSGRLGFGEQGFGSQAALPRGSVANPLVYDWLGQ